MLDDRDREVLDNLLKDVHDGKVPQDVYDKVCEQLTLAAASRYVAGRLGETAAGPTGSRDAPVVATQGVL